MGDVDSTLDTVERWEKENATGVIHYLENGQIRGAMMCNVWDKVPMARQLILEERRNRPRTWRGPSGNSATHEQDLSFVERRLSFLVGYDAAPEALGPPYA